MEIVETPLQGLLQIQPKIFGDDRGFFFESYNAKRYQEGGIDAKFVQDNCSHSTRGVLRGLHFQTRRAQGKLVSVLQGEVFDVAVDLRWGSPSFGKSFSLRLSAAQKNQLWLPPGFAHGFCVLSEQALFTYKCTEYYHPEFEQSLAWDDPCLDIQWPIATPSLSPKDQCGRLLRDLKEDELTPFLI